MLRTRRVIWFWLLCTLIEVWGREELIDGYAVRVSTEIITMGEVVVASRPALQEAYLKYGDDQFQLEQKRIFNETKQKLVDAALVMEEARFFFSKADRKIPERTIDERIQADIRRQYGDRRAFLKVLQQRGTTFADYRERVRDRLVTDEFTRLRFRRVGLVSPWEIRKYYLEHLHDYTSPARVRCRVIAVQKGTTPEENKVKKERAEKLMSRVLAGEDFASVARTESEGPGARDGGDLGWRNPDELVSPVAEAVRTMKTGDIRGLIETETLYWIVKLEGHEEARTMPLEQVSVEIAERLQKDKEAELHGLWVEQLRRRHFIRIFGLP